MMLFNLDYYFIGFLEGFFLVADVRVLGREVFFWKESVVFGRVDIRVKSLVFKFFIGLSVLCFVFRGF